ncbi:MAG TPA: hypothetical protein VMM84_15650 [Pyrinomonadaceae bacterium]|nr:hypothetical protein [Pyrinomonadaceae bacterium]
MAQDNAKLASWWGWRGVASAIAVRNETTSCARLCGVGPRAAALWLSAIGGAVAAAGNDG